MKAIAILSLIFAALSIFIPVGGVYIALMCSVLALISFYKQTTLSGVTFGINIINTLFLSPSLYFDSDVQVDEGKVTDFFIFCLSFHVVLLISAIVIYFVLNKKRDKKLFKWLGITAIILIVILCITGRNNNSNKQEENKPNINNSSHEEKPEKINLNSNNNNQKITQAENSKKQEISLTENEAKLIELALKDDINVGFSGGQSLLIKNYIFTTAEEIQKTYSANEARGDHTFKNKNIVVSGIIDSISSGIGDIPVIYLKTNEMFKNVLMKFDEKYQNIAIDLNKNEELNFYCKGDGVVIGNPTLSQCKPVDIAKNNELEHQLELVNKILKIPDLAGKDNINQIHIISLVKYIGDKSNNFSSCKSIDVDCFKKMMEKYQTQKNFQISLKEKTKFLFKNLAEKNSTKQ